ELSAGVVEAVRTAERADGDEGQAHRAGHDAIRHHDVRVLVRLHAPLADRLLYDGPEEEEAHVELRGAPCADEQRRRDPGELRAHPEVLLLLADHLADERRRPALE